MSLDIRVIHEGPLYERLMTRWDLEREGGYISAYVLFLATPTPAWNGGRIEDGGAGVWYFPIVIGLNVGSAAERVRRLAERLLEATLSFLRLLDGGEPQLLELELTPELWPKKAR